MIRMLRTRLGAVRNVVRVASCGYSNGPVMPPCDFTPSPYKGPDYGKARDIRKNHLNPVVSTMTYYKEPLLVHQGYMQWLFDHEGRRYLDMFGGIVTVSVGHCHPKVTAAAKDQLSKLWHTTHIYMHPQVHDFAEKLTSHLPGDLKVVYFTNSGSEANDLAILMARVHTGAFDIISLRNAYHGASPYTMGLTSLSTFSYPLANGFGCHQTANPDVFRGVWGGANCRDSLSQTTRSCSCGDGACEAGDNYANQLKDVLMHSCPKKVAAFFAEPIQGVGGVVQYPKNFLPQAAELIRERGGLVIADEVQTGFGRTGSHFWGFQTHGITPDIVTMAKGIGNGYPLAAIVTTPEISQSLNKALHVNTFGGNPVACAVGSAVLDVIKEEGIQANAARVGEVLIRGMMKLRDQFEVVGDVRGKGLMVGVELVTDKQSRQPLPAAEVSKIWEKCKDMGVLLGKGGLYGNVFRVKPPMCITEEDAQFACEVLEVVLKECQ
ncbi:alanine--glyoxylate aminotransferase 2, mitochondrial-like [Dysidea avara]|uniref:alanine--glyoxylate aminotransferase 2, mitochondrial-like n=1 Tax=Dysidea avara TaxID=196820 RepID=UPI003334636D